MKQLGLIGYPLTHSFSKKYFTEKFEQLQLKEYHYELFSIENIEMFPDLIAQNPALIGLNVTIPYKEKVIPYLDEIELSAKAIGAVNTIRIEDQKLIGFNTDVFGFEQSLLEAIEVSKLRNINKALILGSGGAAKAVSFVLRKLNISPLIVSRNPSKGDLTYHDISGKVVKENQLIINTTPLGMSPNISSAPDIPFELLNSRHLLFDLVYNPKKTLFLKKGEAQGAWIKNGLQMLYKQAEKAWQIWNDLDTN